MTEPAGAAPGAHTTADKPPAPVVDDCAHYRGGERSVGDAPVRRGTGDDEFLWVTLHAPSADDMATLTAQLDLPELAVEDAVQAHQRPKLDTYDGVVFMILKSVRHAGSTHRLETNETAIFLGPGFLVTVRHGSDDVLHRVRRELDSNSGELVRPSPSGVLHRLADLVVDDYEGVLELLDNQVDDVEEQVFGPHDSDQAERIYQLKQQVAELRRVVVGLVAPMQHLATGVVSGVDAALAPYFRDVHDHVLRAADGIDSADRVLSDVLQADISQVSVRQNEIALRQNEVAARQNEDMRKISAWAAIGLVPTAVAGIYGMNFDNMPELHTRYGYYVVLVAIAAACGLLYTLFRRNGWL
jgi:magnesium transporter